MRDNRQHSHRIDGLSVLFLFAAFTVCILLVLLLGADAYRRVTSRDQSAYDRRTAVQYLSTKVRQTKNGGAVSLLPDAAAGDVLVLAEEAGGEAYVTLIYCYGGWLRELFTAAGTDFSPDAGEKLFPAQGLSLELEDGALLCVLNGETGGVLRFTLSLRGGKEGAS